MEVIDIQKEKIDLRKRESLKKLAGLILNLANGRDPITLIYPRKEIENKGLEDLIFYRDTTLQDSTNYELSRPIDFLRTILKKSSYNFHWIYIPHPLGTDIFELIRC